MQFTVSEFHEASHKYGKLASMARFHDYILIVAEYGMIYKMVIDESGDARSTEFARV